MSIFAAYFNTVGNSEWHTEWSSEWCSEWRTDRRANCITHWGAKRVSERWAVLTSVWLSEFDAVGSAQRPAEWSALRPAICVSFEFTERPAVRRAQRVSLCVSFEVSERCTIRAADRPSIRGAERVSIRESQWVSQRFAFRWPECVTDWITQCGSECGS
jgi:hypothetical protein